jgi:hypothetical protein
MGINRQPRATLEERHWILAQRAPAGARHAALLQHTKIETLTMDIASERDELKRKLDNWHTGTLMLALIVVPLLGAHIFQSRPWPTYATT